MDLELIGDVLETHKRILTEQDALKKSALNWLEGIFDKVATESGNLHIIDYMSDGPLDYMGGVPLTLLSGPVIHVRQVAYIHKDSENHLKVTLGNFDHNCTHYLTAFSLNSFMYIIEACQKAISKQNENVENLKQKIAESLPPTSGGWLRMSNPSLAGCDYKRIDENSVEIVVDDEIKCVVIYHEDYPDDKCEIRFSKLEPLNTLETKSLIMKKVGETLCNAIKKTYGNE